MVCNPPKRGGSGYTGICIGDEQPCVVATQSGARPATLLRAHLRACRRAGSPSPTRRPRRRFIGAGDADRRKIERDAHFAELSKRVSDKGFKVTAPKGGTFQTDAEAYDQAPEMKPRASTMETPRLNADRPAFKPCNPSKLAMLSCIHVTTQATRSTRQ